MKKLKLSNFDLSEILSRDELREIVGGGLGSGSGSGSRRGSGSGSRRGSGSSGGTNPKVAACLGKKENDYCVYTLNGINYQGYCHAFMFGTLHCSDLA